MLIGRCTPEGCGRFAERAVRRGVSEAHFRRCGDLVLGSIGVGTYLGEPDGVTDAYMIEAIKDSVTRGGFNVIDTAINYRFMKSERAVGAAVRELVEEGSVARDELLICSKAGYLTHDADLGVGYEEYVLREIVARGVATLGEIAAGIHCISPRYLRWSIERSLDNLGLECIDVLYLHNAAEAQVPVVGRKVFEERLRDALGFLEDERRRGVIASYGLATWSSLRSPAEAEEHVNLQDVVDLSLEVGGRGHGFRFVQLPFNVAMKEALFAKNQLVNGAWMSLFEAAETLGIAAITSAPLLEGYLLKTSGLRIGELTRAQSLIQIARSTQAVVVLVGHKSPEHVRENIELSRLSPLPRDLVASLLSG